MPLGWVKMKVLSVVLGFLCFFASAAVADTIFVLGKSIPQFMTEKPGSMFPEILREAAKRAGHEIELRIFPGRRALAMFNSGEGDVLAPVQLELMNPGPFEQKVVGSEPIVNRPRFIFSKQNSKIYRSFDDLKNIRLGLVRGFKYGQTIDNHPELNITFGNDIPQLVQMLNRDRIDAIIAFPHSIRRLKNLKVEEVPIYDSTSPITPNHIAFAFRDTPRGRALRDSISNAMVDMKRDGTMGRLAAPMIAK